jgi:hypothetical protein
LAKYDKEKVSSEQNFILGEQEEGEQEEGGLTFLEGSDGF